MLALVDEAEAALVGGDLDEFGRLLDYTWRLKRGVNAAVSNDTIDSIYNAAREAGALGGKLLGAGGGGFLLFYVQPDRQADVRKALEQLKEIPFKFESGAGEIGGRRQIACPKAAGGLAGHQFGQPYRPHDSDG